jgi:hypothetical protein
VCEYTEQKIQECINVEVCIFTNYDTVLSSRMSGFQFVKQTQSTEALRQPVKRSHPREPLQGYKDDNTSLVRGDVYDVKLWDI